MSPDTLAQAWTHLLEEMDWDSILLDERTLHPSWRAPRCNCQADPHGSKKHEPIPFVSISGTH